MDFEYEHGGRSYKVSAREDKNTFKIVIDGNEVVSEVLVFNQGFLKFSLGNLLHKAVVSKDKDALNVFINGTVFRLATPHRKAGGPKKKVEEEGDLNCPISGKVVKVLVAEGDRVEAKQDLLILEAMKMEHKVKAPYAGIVKKVNFGVDDKVDVGQLLVDLERTDEQTDGGQA